MVNALITEKNPTLGKDLKGAGKVFRLCTMNEFFWSEATYHRRKRTNYIDGRQQIYVLNIFESIISTIRDRHCIDPQNNYIAKAIDPWVTDTFPSLYSLHEILSNLYATHRKVLTANFNWSDAKYYRKCSARPNKRLVSTESVDAARRSAAWLFEIYLKKIADFRQLNDLNTLEHGSFSVLVETVNSQFAI